MRQTRNWPLTDTYKARNTIDPLRIAQADLGLVSNITSICRNVNHTVKKDKSNISDYLNLNEILIASFD